MCKKYLPIASFGEGLYVFDLNVFDYYVKSVSSRVDIFFKIDNALTNKWSKCLPYRVLDSKKNCAQDYLKIIFVT